MITTDDLHRMYGSAVQPRHKVALNQLSVAICQTLGKAAPKAKEISQVRTTQPLPLDQRALPSELIQPQGNPHLRKTAGTADIRDLLTQTLTNPVRINTESGKVEVNRYPKISLSQRQNATHQKMAKEDIRVGSSHLPPSSVGPEVQGSMATFWQQRQELYRTLPREVRASLCPEGDTCTWEDFKEQICSASNLPTEMIASLYDEQFNITGVTGYSAYNRGRTRQHHYHVTWAPTVMPRKHFEAATKAYQHEGEASPLSDTDLAQAADYYPVYMLSRDGELAHLDLVQVNWASSSDFQANLERRQPNFKKLLAE
jgi:hypothetical protein